MSYKFTDNNHNNFFVSGPNSANDGSLPQFNMQVPVGAATGVATLTATDKNNKAVTGNFTVTGQPHLASVTPTSASPGETVLVVGSGFSANQTITFSIGGVAAAVYSGGMTDGGGNLNNTLIVVPQMSAGTYSLVATDPLEGASNSLSFTVTGTSATPTSTTTGAGNLTLSPSSGPPSIQGGTSTTVTLSGYNLPANTTVTAVYLLDGAGHSITLTPSSSVTTSSGTYSGSVTLPSSAAGGNGSIELIVGTAVASASFLITPVLTINGQAATASSPVQVQGGQTVQINGAGFKASTIVNFTMNLNTPLQTNPATVASDANGNLSATVTIPSNLSSGTYYITSMDQTGNEQYPVYVSVLSGTPTPTVTSTATATPSPTWTPIGYVPPTATPTWTPYGYATATSTPAPTSQATVTTDYFAEGYTGQASTNGKATFTEVLNILNPNPAAASATITYYIEGSTTPIVVTRQLPASAMYRESVNNDVGPDKAVAAVVTSNQGLVVTRTITRISAGNTRLDGSTTQPASAPATTLGFPEGFTGITYQEYLTILNPNTSAASVNLYLAPQTSGPATPLSIPPISVPPLSRVTVNVRALNTRGGPKSVGMVLNSNVPIVAERVEYFGDGVGSGKFGSSVSQGITSPATDMRIPYAASGGSAPDSTGHVQAVGDQAFVTLLNPSTSSTTPAQVTVGFGNSQGQPVGQPVQVTLYPGTRQTVVVNTAAGAAAVGPLSVSVSSTAPIMAECAQYYGGSPNVGTHPGIVTPAFTGATTDAFLSDISTQLADGTAVQRTVYIYNPGTATEQVAATYYGQTGATAQAVYTVPAGGIATVNVNTDTQATIPAGAVGAEFKLATGATGSFIISSVGITADNLSTTEDVGVPLP